MGLLEIIPLIFLVYLLPFSQGKVTVGVDIFKAGNYRAIDGTTLAVLSNPTSLLDDFTHLVDDLAANRPNEIKLILGPEHGFRGNLQAETGLSLSVEFILCF
jgi:uncharacterized protein YbbC (DUF1343 family)